MSVAYEEVERFIINELAAITGASVETINADTVLIGQNRVVDSADLVVLLLAVEEFAQERLSFDWNWTSDSAMSEARSVLRNVGSLARHLTELQPA